MVKYRELREKVDENARKVGLEIVPPSSTISWLYPGQFAYCLNEEFIWDRYGGFVDSLPRIHFHKIQPVIRWDDFVKYFQEVKKDKAKEDSCHLGHFDMSTITGGHIIDGEKTNEYESRAFTGLFDFLINECGLERRKFIVTYFSGARLSEIGVGKNGYRKYKFDVEFAPDTRAKKLFSEVGISPSQMKVDPSRDCFLIPNWICGEVAPWGYRNEINYETEQGLVDIATIERLSLFPLRQNDEIVGVRPWEKSFVISGTGLERLAMVSEGLKKIQDVENVKPIYEACEKHENGINTAESLRIFHRIVADSRGDLSDRRGHGKNRNRKYRKLMGNAYTLDLPEIQELLQINAEAQPWHPELAEAVDYAVSEIKEYAGRRQ